MGRTAGRNKPGLELTELESNRRIQLFQLLSFVGVAMLFAFGLLSLSQGLMQLALLLIGVAVVCVLNMVWLHVQRNYNASAFILASCVTLLNLVLVATGGVSDSGLLWVYPMAAIVVFITGFRAGLYLSLFTLLACVVILYWPNTPLLQASYAPEIKIRFLASLFSLLVACLGCEFVYVNSRGRVRALHESVQRASVTDALTRLPNRRFVSESCIRRGFFDRSFEGGTLLLADIDHFKKINDQYGHEAGDQVLSSFAEYLVTVTRDEDVVVRWGGEEFLLLLPGLNLQRAWNRADEIREGLGQVAFDDLSEPVTVSIGLAEILPQMTADSLLSLADKNLYGAKAAGRNCVVG
ncbi:GGDEF domain-containing protein [Simiduia sp. 21SJ11W-1]|uniref:GGDEF domain-containing protein n=1 Tax=Simiduia sp. 21SJ11W-1 TaxID=2909669 RepID=UPI0020A20723|nr:GGDEF domain-containing protein [Simiduia sp. 21SJ11W-1]UTA46958.1 GGDEF domain-containing protein [Simiduia sp. 21SJ11W-1]